MSRLRRSLWAGAALSVTLLGSALLLSLVTATSPMPRAHPGQSGPHGTEARPGSGPVAAAGRIAWEAWEPEAFARAAREDKLVFLDLTAVWCHACHVMEETTYQDAEVVSLLTRRFVPIQVDTDRRPDIDARYRQGGWPTTSVLLPSGEILWQANFLEADELVLALEESEAHYRAHRAELIEQARSIWAKVDAALQHRPAVRHPINGHTVVRSAALLKARYDPDHGGFGQGAKFLEPEAIAFALTQAYWAGNEELKDMALQTLDAQLRLLDPVRGGFYRYAENADWSQPHSEKLLEVQAVALGNYVEAFEATGRARYRSVAEQVIDYVNGVLLNPDGNAFYASQAALARSVQAAGLEPEAGAPDGPAAGRHEAAGVPRVDRVVYTASNALIADRYLQAAMVLGRAELRDTALRVLDRLFHDRYRQGKGVARLAPTDRPEPLILLGDQVALGQALLQAFQVTGDRRYLERAELVAADLVAHLGDPAGGFYDRPRSEQEQGLLRFPQMPPRENLRAAILLADLSYLTGHHGYRDRAERTLRVIMGRGETLPVALVGLAVDRFLRAPLHIVVVGSRGEARSQALLDRARRAYVPGKIVRILDPARESLVLGEVTFPRTAEATAYVCTNRYCSNPTTDPDELPDRIASVRRALSAISVAR